jgi:hypothetical protein
MNFPHVHRRFLRLKGADSVNGGFCHGHLAVRCECALTRAVADRRGAA